MIKYRPHEAYFRAYAKGMEPEEWAKWVAFGIWEDEEWRKDGSELKGLWPFGSSEALWPYRTSEPE